MFNLGRLYLPKIARTVRDKLMQEAVKFVRAEAMPIQIIFFGSVLTENFDEASDIDLLLIFATQSEADAARHALYRARKPQTIAHPLEMICIDKATYDKKSQIGGICFVARNEGRSFYSVP
jgi:predicted nucleotidyltransferase